MAEVTDIVQSYLDRDALESLGKRVGADPSMVQRVASMALPLLVGGLSRNVNDSPRGRSSQDRSSLNAALERDHDGSLLDRLGSRLGGVGGGGGGPAGAWGGGSRKAPRAPAGWTVDRSGRCWLRWRRC